MSPAGSNVDGGGAVMACSIILYNNNIMNIKTVVVVGHVKRKIYWRAHRPLNNNNYHGNNLKQ